MLPANLSDIASLGNHSGHGMTPTGTKSWSESLTAFFERRTLTLFFFGISAGLPLLLIFSTLSVWLTEAGIARSEVTFFSWAALGYGFKWVWAPLIDRIPLPFLGRRRAWLLVSQCAIVMSLVGMALTDPAQAPVSMALFAVSLGFSSATQDIVIDAYRIEIADQDRQAILSAAYIAGYRVGMLLAGAGALEIAGWLDTGQGYDYRVWQQTYLIMAGAMSIGIVTTLFSREPEIAKSPSASYSVGDYCRFFLLFLASSAGFGVVFAYFPELGLTGPLGGFLQGLVTFTAAVGSAVTVFWIGLVQGIASRDLVVGGYFDPLRDFITRYGKHALLLLALIASYRIADIVMGVISNVFYIELGFEKQDVGRITKGFGLVMTLIGGFLGGVLSLRFGVIRILLLGAILTAATNVLFSVLASVGADLGLLIAVISADNLSAGLASAAFVAFLSALTSIRFTAMQYATLSSIMLLIPKLIGGYSGSMVDAMGYEWFFIGTALMGIPVCILVFLVARLETRTQGDATK